MSVLILNMSITGSIAILFVLFARLILKKAPKIFSYALWAVVLFRLLCPVSIATDFSLLRLFDTPAVENTQHTTAVEYIPYDAVYMPDREFHLPMMPTISETLSEMHSTEHADLDIYPLTREYTITSIIWILGIIVLSVYSLVSYILLRWNLIGAVRLRKNIYLADSIATPFVMGIVRPRIYLPSALSKQEQKYIILHEQHHIRRGDHIFKILAFWALCIHWFNPLVWVAFVQSSKDMEMSCDEAVLKKLGDGIRADYSASLLSLSTGRHMIAGTLLAFGEGNTKSRIKNILKWKRSKPIVIILSAAAVILVLILCGTNATQNAVSEGETEQIIPQSHTPDADDTSKTSKGYEIAEELSYYLELAAGTEFQNMNPERQTSILKEYEDLLKDYTLIARESTDGRAAYIVGQSNTEPEQSSLHRMYGIELSAGGEDVFQFLYREDESGAVEEILAENRTDFPSSIGYRIDNSRILWSSNGESVLIQPENIELLMDVPYNRCLHTPNGREYIVDAVSRGIDVCGQTDTFLYVYRISEQFGEISERIALTETEAKMILEEESRAITNGFGFSATLHMNGETIYYNERSGVPQTILDLAVEKCDYRFETPDMIIETIQEARLDGDWLETPLYAKSEDLSRLQEILKNAEFGYVGGCGYGAKLSLTFSNGETMTVFKGCDGCDTIVFGSYGGYFLGDKENTEFWEIFGLDPESKLPK